MSETTWASETLRTHVAPPGVAQYVAERIRHAARSLGWDYNRVRDIWYADPRVSLKPRELRRIEEYTGLRYGRQELSEVDALIANANTLLAVGQDEDFHGPFVAAIRALVSAFDRSRASRGGGK